MGAIHYLAVGLGLLLLYRGAIKVVPINPGVGQGYDDMRSECKRFASVSPFKAIGIDLSPDMYCSLLGVFEVVIGSLLAFGRYRYRVLSAMDTFCLMNLAVYTFYALGDELPNLILSFVGEILSILIIAFRKGLEVDSPTTKAKRN